MKSCTYQIGYEDVDGVVSEWKACYVPPENINRDRTSTTKSWANYTAVE